MENISLAGRTGLSTQQVGLVLALLCYTLWCVADAAIKEVALEGVPPFETMAIYGWIATAVLGTVTAARGRLAALRPVNMRAVLMRALLITVIGLCNYVAFAHLSLAMFYAIIFLSPFFVAIGARLFLHEAFSWGVGVTILAGFIGVVVAVNPVELLNGKGELIGYAAVLGAVASFSGAQLFLRHLSRDEAPESLVFMPMLISAIVSSVPAFFTFEAVSWRAVLILAFAAAINIVANLSMVAAMRKTAAATIAGLHYSQIIPGAIFGYLLWNEVPLWNVWAGSAIIIMAGLAMARLAHGKIV